MADWTAQSTYYAYDAVGQLLTAALPIGVTSSYGYNSAYRLATITHQTALATLGAYTYTVDAGGNRTGCQQRFRKGSFGILMKPPRELCMARSGQGGATRHGTAPLHPR